MAETEQLRFQIEGMHCGGCVTRLTNVLKKTPGVTVRDVQVGSAEVAYMADQASPEQIKAVIQKAGFRAVPVAGTKG